MSLLTPYQRLLRNLRQEIDPNSRAYMSRDAALQELRAMSGEDYGYDADRWELWIRSNSDELDWSPAGTAAGKKGDRNQG